jgi:predicted nuclease with TOPRIM domain
MNSDVEQLRDRIASLETENARLRETLEMVKAERKELRDRICGPVNEEDLPSEEEYLAMIRDHVPGSGVKFLEELGIHLETKT